MSTGKFRVKLFSPFPKELFARDTHDSQENDQLSQSDLKTPSTPTETNNPFKTPKMTCPPTPTKTPSTKRRRGSQQRFALFQHEDSIEIEKDDTMEEEFTSPAKRRLANNFDKKLSFIETGKVLDFGQFETPKQNKIMKCPDTVTSVASSCSSESGEKCSLFTHGDQDNKTVSSPILFDDDDEKQKSDEELEDVDQVDESYSDDEFLNDDLTGQSQMIPSTPPKMSQNQKTEPVQIPRIPLTTHLTHKVHENPFSPERRSGQKHERSSTPPVETAPKKARRRRHTITSVIQDAIEEFPTVEGYFSRYLNDFQELKVIGVGSFGKVTKCKNRIDGLNYAIKQTKREYGGDKDLQNLLREAHALSTQVNNPYIVRYYGAWIENHTLFVQTELCEGGSLSENLHKNVYMSEKELLKIMRHVAAGLHQMHNQNLVHLDIKPENIYVTEKGTYKIGDLGLVASLFDKDKDLQEGDSRYLAREILNPNSVDLTKVDIFALGASIYELARCVPLPANGKEWVAIRDGYLNEQALKNRQYSDEFIALLKSLMHKDPTKRPSAWEILSHKLVKQSKPSYEELEQYIFNLEETLRKQKCIEEELRMQLQRKN